jgi:hypothetical protein
MINDMDDLIMTKHPTITSRCDAVRLLTAAALSGTFVTASPVAAQVPIRKETFDDAIHLEKGLIDMAQDLANLAPEHFEPLIGHTFTIGDHQVTLRDVRRLGPTTSRFREQFSLLFSLPHEMPVGSEVLPVSHPTLGRCELLVTQVIDEAEGTTLEICFA